MPDSYDTFQYGGHLGAQYNFSIGRENRFEIEVPFLAHFYENYHQIQTGISLAAIFNNWGMRLSYRFNLDDNAYGYNINELSPNDTMSAEQHKVTIEANF